jgi:hypothetical protein
MLTEELAASNEKIAELVHENVLLKETNHEVCRVPYVPVCRVCVRD